MQGANPRVRVFTQKGPYGSNFLFFVLYIDRSKTPCGLIGIQEG